MCSCIQACCRYGKLNIQAGTQFCDKSFSEEVAKGKISSVSLDKFTCVALAGVTAEYLKYGRAEGGLGDVQQLDALLRAIGVEILQLVLPGCFSALACKSCITTFLLCIVTKPGKCTAAKQSSAWNLHGLCTASEHHYSCCAWQPVWTI